MKWFLTFIFLTPVLSSQANITLPSIISSNMVIQQKSTVKIWGWASPAEKVFLTGSWNNTTDSAITTNNAKWEINLKTPAAGGPFTITLKGNNTIILDNVLVGEVWLCSGQSNMEYNYYNGLEDVKAELPAAFNNNIRFFNIPKTTSEYPQDNCKANWVICDSNSLKSFSAVGYFFGKRLSKELNVPVGLINASWGGTPAEVWAPAAIVNGNDTLKQAASQLKEFPWWPIKPGYAYNGMVAPITKFNIAGVIWYQGEGNTAYPSTYSALFTSMISGWRKQWDKQLPFYYVQIAPFNYGNNKVGAMIQEQQTRSLSLPNTGMVVVSDLVEDTGNIHPRNKHDVGARLANLALAKTYFKPVAAYEYPVFKSLSIEKDKAVISFNNVSTGLIGKGKTVSPVFIAGEDKIFYPAESEIMIDKLIVWNKKVQHPVAVRYAFGNTAIGNLFSREGLPVVPFRTDNWDQ